MRGIVYVSQASKRFTSDTLVELANQSASCNEQLGITGYLYFANNQFIQYIEGAPQTVNDLMSRITQDARHEVLYTVHEDNLPARRFPSWSMRWLEENDLAPFHMENVLSEHLLCMKNTPVKPKTWRPAAWNMVNSIARLQIHMKPSHL